MSPPRTIRPGFPNIEVFVAVPENKIKKMKNGHLAPGAYTPSMAFGADYVLDLEGTKLSRVKLHARYALRATQE